MNDIAGHAKSHRKNANEGFVQKGAYTVSISNAPQGFTLSTVINFHSFKHIFIKAHFLIYEFFSLFFFYLFHYLFFIIYFCSNQNYFYTCFHVYVFCQNAYKLLRSF